MSYSIDLTRDISNGSIEDLLHSPTGVVLKENPQGTAARTAATATEVFRSWPGATGSAMPTPAVAIRLPMPSDLSSSWMGNSPVPPQPPATVFAPNNTQSSVPRASFLPPSSSTLAAIADTLALSADFVASPEKNVGSQAPQIETVSEPQQLFTATREECLMRAKGLEPYFLSSERKAKVCEKALRYQDAILVGAVSPREYYPVKRRKYADNLMRLLRHVLSEFRIEVAGEQGALETLFNRVGRSLTEEMQTRVSNLLKAAPIPKTPFSWKAKPSQNKKHRDQIKELMAKWQSEKSSIESEQSQLALHLSNLKSMSEALLGELREGNESAAKRRAICPEGAL